MKPSDYSKEYPWNCVFNQSEYETIAVNVIRILKRTVNEWRELSWDEYKKERLKDGNFSEGERYYFDKVIPYCKSWQDAIKFSPKWAAVPGEIAG